MVKDMLRIDLEVVFKESFLIFEYTFNAVAKIGYTKSLSRDKIPADLSGHSCRRHFSKKFLTASLVCMLERATLHDDLFECFSYVIATVHDG